MSERLGQWQVLNLRTIRKPPGPFRRLLQHLMPKILKDLHCKKLESAHRRRSLDHSRQLSLRRRLRKQRWRRRAAASALTNPCRISHPVKFTEQAA